MTHFNLVHKFIPMPQAMKIPDAKKSCSGQGMEKARDNPSMATGENQEREKGFLEARRDKTVNPLCYTDGHMSLQKKNAEVQPKLQKYNGRVVFRVDIVKKALAPTQLSPNRAPLCPK